MTVGQRIAQKRKELGLSQEGLGERLGVSRQAIYKWESDAALPEIEKLVKLGREFSVSVGWLLGEEDETPEKPELTPEQLRMVEEIVGRYLDAQPAAGPAKKRKEDTESALPWFLGLLVKFGGMAAVFLLLLLLYWRMSDLQERYHNMKGSLEWSIQSVNEQVAGITNRVEEILQSQNTLTAEQSAGVAATDYKANTVTVTAQALPRTYVEGMTAEFIMVSDGKTITVPGTLGADHAFSADITGPLTDNISVTVAFLTGDQRETQLLEQFSYLYSDSFPDVMVMDDLWGSSDKIREYASVHVSEEEAARISNIRLGLFRDGKLLVWYEHLDEQPSAYLGDWSDTEFFRVDGEWTMEPGRVYCQAAVVVDEYGRERVYPSCPVTYDAEERFANSVNGNISYDPADWDY